MSTRSEDRSPAAGLDAAPGRALRGGLDLPLSALRAMLEGLERDLGDDPRAETVAHALREVSRAGRAVRDLVDFATLPEPVPVDCTAQGIVQGALARLAPEDRRRVLIARSGRDLAVRADALLCEGALRRLLENALEATSGAVLVSVRREGARVRVATINPDPLDALDPARIDAPFRTDKPRRLGLGLALARRDLELCGGSLALARTPRGAAVVTAWIPAGEDA